MKYMISWYERSQGSPIEYENAQNAYSKYLVSGRHQTTLTLSCLLCGSANGVVMRSLNVTTHSKSTSFVQHFQRLNFKSTQ